MGLAVDSLRLPRSEPRPAALQRFRLDHTEEYSYSTNHPMQQEYGALSARLATRRRAILKRQDRLNLIPSELTCVLVKVSQFHNGRSFVRLHLVFTSLH